MAIKRKRITQEEFDNYEMSDVEVLDMEKNAAEDLGMSLGEYLEYIGCDMIEIAQAYMLDSLIKKGA